MTYLCREIRRHHSAFLNHLLSSVPAGLLNSMTKFLSLVNLPARRILAIASLVICIAIADRSQAQTFMLDNDHTSLVFAVSHSGLSFTYGRFNQCSGEILLSDTADDQSFVFSVDAASVDTNNQLRDDHLKGPDFFDVQAFPEIEFSSTKLSNDGDKFEATGVLKIHGTEKDITIELTKIGMGKGPRGKTRVGFFSKFSVKRSDFNIKTLPTVIGDQIAITLSFEAVLLPDAEAKAKVDDAKDERVKSRLDGPVALPVKLEKQYNILEP